MSDEWDDPKLSGWHFDCTEISNGCWRVNGRHTDGRSVSREGYSEAETWSEAIEDARKLGRHRYLRCASES
jgi:hypothetical protein